MTLDEMNAFMALVQLQSTRETAELLGLTQPAITRRVQSLEASLGVVLLDRQTKPLKPTAMGRRVYRQCERISNELALLRQLVEQDAPPSGVLRLGLPQSITDIGVAPALMSLTHRYPHIEPRLSSNWGVNLLQGIQKGIVDAALLLYPAGNIFPEGLQSKDLGAVPLVVATAAGGGPLPTTLAACHQQGWVLNPTGCGFRGGLERALKDRGLPMRINMEVTGNDLQLALIADGGGLGLVPRYLLENSVYAGRLRILPLQDFQPDNRLWLVHPVLPRPLAEAAASFGSTVAARLGLTAPLAH
ncbi:LysR family transcriptional regulator (plasmid) [Sodalis praecaptivus]|uniref:LysR family transcriptional regulator n=1 Tax=Sodalis praecaptivus TaxID=1239307 RepID=W0I3J8_9GAMM|nr:LysR family transcriptional regulator [Sodalis praecaptivus]AHF79317.1 LysR family transcriptional regulator [Sodalis praecaptivus]